MKKIWRFLLLLLFLIPNAQAADPNAHQFGSRAGWYIQIVPESQQMGWAAGTGQRSV